MNYARYLEDFESLVFKSTSRGLWSSKARTAIMNIELSLLMEPQFSPASIPAAPVDPPYGLVAQAGVR